MHKFLAALVIVLASFSGIPAAQAQCLLCGVVGYMLGSSNESATTTSNSGSVLYVAPRISERISEPLGVHISASQHLFFAVTGALDKQRAKGATIQQIFGNTVVDPEKYTILEVMRVIIPDNANTAVFWFAYLENEKVTPLDKLLPPKKK